MFSRFFNKKSDSSPDEDPIPSAAPAASLPNDTDFEHVSILLGNIYNHPDPISSLSDCTGSRTFDSWTVPSIQPIRNSDTTKYRQRTSSEPHRSPIQALCHCPVQEQRLSGCTAVPGPRDPLQDEEQPGQAIPIGLWIQCRAKCPANHLNVLLIVINIYSKDIWKCVGPFLIIRNNMKAQDVAKILRKTSDCFLELAHY